MSPEHPANLDPADDAVVPPLAAPDDRPIVVFGGTFDPPHQRHVDVASAADKLLRAKRLLVVPAWANPQRPGGPQASVADRLAMCTLAFQDLADTEVSSVETDQKRACFTVETLEALHAQQKAGALPSGRFRLLIGSDQALNFRTWKEWERVIILAEPVVVLRPPQEQWDWEAQLSKVWDKGWTARWLAWTLPIDPVDVSSTEVRRRAAAGEPLAELVPEGVVAYIHSRGLYGASAAPTQPE